jgi:DNA-binding ferritin-like protein
MDHQPSGEMKGPQFYQLHVLYDEMAEHLLEHIDNIAERITALGGTAMGTARMAATSSPAGRQWRRWPSTLRVSHRRLLALLNGIDAPI